MTTIDKEAITEENQFVDIREMVFNDEIPLQTQAIYIPRLPGGWFNIREINAEQRGRLLDRNLNQKKGSMNFRGFNGDLLVLSLRYPSPEARPGEDTPEVQSYPMNHPKAGQLVFQPNDGAMIIDKLPSAVSDMIVKPAVKLNGLDDKSLEEEKKD